MPSPLIFKLPLMSSIGITLPQCTPILICKSGLSFTALAIVIAQGREDKVALILELNTLLTSMTRQGQMEQETAIATSLSTQLSKVPLYIYIK